MVARQVGRDLCDMRQGVRRLQGRDDALLAAAQLKGVQCLAVGDRDISDAVEVVQPSVLRPDAGIIKPGRNRMRVADQLGVML